MEHYRKALIIIIITTNFFKILSVGILSHGLTVQRNLGSFGAKIFFDPTENMWAHMCKSLTVRIKQSILETWWARPKIAVGPLSAPKNDNKMSLSHNEAHLLRETLWPPSCLNPILYSNPLSHFCLQI